MSCEFALDCLGVDCDDVKCEQLYVVNGYCEDYPFNHGPIGLACAALDNAAMLLQPCHVAHSYYPGDWDPELPF